MRQILRRIRHLTYTSIFGLRILFKWILFGTLTGIVVGAAATAFYYALSFATNFRTAHPQVILGLPIGGLLIVALYHFMKNDLGTNVVLAAIHKDEKIPGRMAPMIFIATFLTHFFGASAGREGAALQLGGSISAQLGKLLRVNPEDRHIVIMCGMSAGFSAIFGTPLASAIFAMEVISIGIMHYSALVPCVFASLIASIFSKSLGVISESFYVSIIPDFNVEHFIKMIFLSIFFGILSAAFCLMLRGFGKLFKKHFSNPFIRILVSSGLIILLTFIFQTTDYMGAGMDVIEKSFHDGARPEAFLLKMVFTSLALGAGFKGGEIVPSFFIGATFGSLAGPFIGLPLSLSAACGMLGVFCGVTNCPITSLFIGFELFGFQGMPYYLVAVSVSYMMSGYHGLYKEQKIVYSKYQTRFIDRNPK
ncbi:MAG: chloride channel protein [Clostridiales bacterium]|nr:chloride channel protein [Clostridiales bacterium]